MKKPLNYFGHAFEDNALDPERKEAFQKEIEQRGFDSTELWNLYNTVSFFILPRLKAFKQEFASHPVGMTLEHWHSLLDSMIYSFEQINTVDNAEDDPKVQLGLINFAVNFFHLWD